MNEMFFDAGLVELELSPVHKIWMVGGLEGLGYRVGLRFDRGRLKNQPRISSSSRAAANRSESGMLLAKERCLHFLRTTHMLL